MLRAAKFAEGDGARMAKTYTEKLGGVLSAREEELKGRNLKLSEEYFPVSETCSHIGSARRNLGNC